MNYIRYQEVEQLFKMQPVLEAILESLKVDIANAANGVEDDYIYNMVIGNKTLDSIPGGGSISDSTGNTASVYMKSISRDLQSIKHEIKAEFALVNMTLDKLNIAIRQVDPLQQKILKMYYWEGKRWYEILEIAKKDKQYISKRQAQRYKRIAIEKLQMIVKITLDDYKNIIRLVDDRL